jgi:hypothetical protein
MVHTVQKARNTAQKTVLLQVIEMLVSVSTDIVGLNCRKCVHKREHAGH